MLRGAYEQHHNWKINFETTFLNNLNYNYLKNLCSEGKQHGRFVRILSDVMSKKIRDVNSRLKKHFGVSLTIHTKEQQDDEKRHMNTNNKSFFGTRKNIKIHYNLDAYQKLSKEPNMTINYDFLPPSNLLLHLKKIVKLSSIFWRVLCFPLAFLSQFIK